MLMMYQKKLEGYLRAILFMKYNLARYHTLGGLQTQSHCFLYLFIYQRSEVHKTFYNYAEKKEIR